MTPTKKENLRESLISLINSFSPEYISQASYSDYELSQLIDSIEEFETEQEEEDPKEVALKEIERANYSAYQNYL